MKNVKSVVDHKNIIFKNGRFYEKLLKVNKIL